MEFSIKCATCTYKSEWSIVYLRATGKNFPILRILFYEDRLDLTKDEMHPFAIFYLGIYCLQKYLFRGLVLQRIENVSML